MMKNTNIVTRLWGAFRNSLPKEPEPDPNEPVTIVTFQSIAMRSYVDLLRSRLQADGFDCMINGIYDITLQVRRADANEASARLKEIESGQVLIDDTDISKIPDEHEH